MNQYISIFDDKVIKNVKSLLWFTKLTIFCAKVTFFRLLNWTCVRVDNVHNYVMCFSLLRCCWWCCCCCWCFTFSGSISAFDFVTIKQNIIFFSFLFHMSLRLWPPGIWFEIILIHWVRVSGTFHDSVFAWYQLTGEHEDEKVTFSSH